MFSRRLTIDAHPRSKNGRPADSTPGVAGGNWVHVNQLQGAWLIGFPGSISDIEMRKTGSVSAKLIQNRRVISASSELSSSCALTTRGSNAMPQIGHEPGWSRTIPGCIGHV